MKKIIRAKWFILLLAFAIVAFIGRVNKVSSIADTAIIIGLGIDVKNSDYNVSVQTFIPKGDIAGGGVAPTYEVYSAIAPTVSGALTDIGEKLGLVLSLSHCHIIVASKEALDSDINKEVQSLIDSWHLTLQAVMVATEDNPDEVLKAKIPSSNASTSYLQTVLRQTSSFSNLTSLSVKDFFVDSYGKAKVSAVALLEMEELPPDTESNSGSEASGSGGGGGDSSSKIYAFTLNKNLIFGANVSKSFIIEEPYAEVLNAFQVDKKGGRVEITMLDGSVVHYQTINVDGKLKVSKNRVDATIKAQFVLREYKRKGEATSLYRLTDEDRKEIVTKTEEAIIGLLKDTFFLSKTHDVDFFQIEDKMYQKFGRHWEKPQNFLENLEFNANAEITLKRG